jgi:hypothetical protein
MDGLDFSVFFGEKSSKLQENVQMDGKLFKCIIADDFITT